LGCSMPLARYLPMGPHQTKREAPVLRNPNTGKEPLLPQDSGKVPDKLDRSKVRLVSAAKAPVSAHDSGKVPAR